MREKLRTDYKDDPPPAAASLLDILRATIVVDDPYALAVCAAYIQKKFDVLRLKNRFASDPVESVSVERLLSEFYSAETDGGSVPTANGDVAGDLGKLSGYTQQYRDINVNIAFEFPGRAAKFVGEVQFQLSTISILKKSEQKIYSLLRMEDPAELLEQYVFSRKAEGDESTVLTSMISMSAVSGASPALSPAVPQEHASALTAAGFTGGTAQNPPFEIDDEDRGQVRAGAVEPEAVALEVLPNANGIVESEAVAVDSNGALGSRISIHRDLGSFMFGNDFRTPAKSPNPDGPFSTVSAPILANSFCHLPFSNASTSLFSYSALLI
jgi:hypothetical protein